MSIYPCEMCENINTLLNLFIFLFFFLKISVVINSQLAVGLLAMDEGFFFQI
jgi:hypothetical protein